MAIIYDEKNGIFNIMTDNTSYIIGYYLNHLVVHLYYGKRIETADDISALMPYRGRSFAPCDGFGEWDTSTDLLPQEFPTYGSCDLRIPAMHAAYGDGSTVTVFSLDSYRIYDGKPKLEGLPATYAEDGQNVETLEIKLKDNKTGLVALLLYSVFPDKDIITRSVKLINEGEEKINLKRIMSSCMDFSDMDFDFVHLQGTWARERHIQKCPLINGTVSIDSKRGTSSHRHNPFFALARKNADENQGEVYGFSLIYSGNFVAGVEVDPFNSARVYMGINPFNSGWNLNSGEEFQSPEAVMTYSENGFGGMSRNFHDVYRNNLCRGKYKKAERPVLINNWEATYFDFNEHKIIEIAAKAKELGIDMMVLDDGWFGERNNDQSSLGDWFVNKNKLPDGISGLAEKIHKLGMKFGLWFEPEMVSPVSKLYEKHPDWCIHIDGRHRSVSRNQLVLDLSRDDVCEYIIKTVSAILSDSAIDYVKWDMNRHLSELGSSLLAPDKQCELPHRYVLGYYRVMDELTTQFPDVLFEGCSGGGGRFDPGVLYYMPQIWTSDNTDAVERLYIQYGTSMVYPVCTMGAHVSAVPNHQVGRVTPMKMRGDVAMSGQFGYELDLTKLTEEETEEVKQQIITYKSIRNTVHYGDMYRLLSPFEGNHSALQFISEDKKTVVLFYYGILGKPNSAFVNVKMKALDGKAVYKEKLSGKEYFGDVLMNAGIFEEDKHDFYSNVRIFEKQ